jgi:hypothetical protein
MSCLEITGVINADNSFTPDRWRNPDVIKVDAAPEEIDATWSVVALDSKNKVLIRGATSVIKSPVCPNASSSWLKSVLIMPDLTAAVVVKRNDQEAYRRVVPKPASVSLDKPSKEFAAGTVEFRVRIKGSIPSEGAHLVLRWIAPNQVPLPLGIMEVRERQDIFVPIRLSELPGGNGCRFSVAYQDGIRTVEVSEQLNVPIRSATPLIIAPSSNTPVFENGWLSLEGRLDGDGDFEKLEWWLNNERVGIGPRTGIPSPGLGNRIIELRFEDSVARVEIQVRPVSRIESPEWSPPWRHKQLIVVGTSIRQVSQRVQNVSERAIEPINTHDIDQPPEH